MIVSSDWKSISYTLQSASNELVHGNVGTPAFVRVLFILSENLFN
jgi:hypothetical protein